MFFAFFSFSCAFSHARSALKKKITMVETVKSLPFFSWRAGAFLLAGHFLFSEIGISVLVSPSPIIRV